MTAVGLGHDALPLAGMRVVGLEHSVAGPLCTRILGDLGAEVVKLERPSGGDFARHWDGNVSGESAQFWWLNRRKRSIVLDLKAPEGRRRFEALLGEADAFVCNFSPGAARRLGVAGPDLRERHPRLVSCQISGYGVEGAYAERKAYDMLVQAEAGIMSLTGTADQPARAGVSISDVSTGIYAALLVVAALLARERGGEGRHVEATMMDSTLEFAAPMLVSFLNAGVIYPRLADRHHAIAPYGRFACRDGSAVLVAIEQDDEWRRFAAAIDDGRGLAGDPRFATNHDRLSHRGEVDGIVGAAIEGWTVDEAIAVFERLGLAYAVVNDMRGVADHPAVRDRGAIQDVAMADGSIARTFVGLAEREFRSADDERLRPPGLGEDTAQFA